MKTVMAQINTTVGDIKGNRDLILSAMKKAGDLKADLAVFPELSLTGYPPRDLLGLHGFVEANLQALDEIAAHTHEVAAIIGFVDFNRKKEGRAFYNSAAFLWQGKLQAVIHKTLLPTYDVFDEDRYFERSEEVTLMPFRGRLLGISICEDAWNPEDLGSGNSIRSIRSEARSKRAPTFSSISRLPRLSWKSPSLAFTCSRDT